MINTTDLLIAEGRKMTKKPSIPTGYAYMGESFSCLKCGEDAVFGDLWANEEEGYSGDFKCMACGYEWSKV